MIKKSEAMMNLHLVIMVALMFLAGAVGLFIPNLFNRDGMMVIEAERNKLQIVTAQEGDYTNIGVIDASELLTIEGVKYYVNNDGKLMTGFSVDGEFIARATTETETNSYIKHLYNSGELEVPNAWAVSMLGVGELKSFLISLVPLTLIGAACLASIELAYNKKYGD